MKPLKDNTPVPVELAPLCQRVQNQVYAARCTLVDLLDDQGQGAVSRRAKPPKLFQYWDDGTLAVGNYVGQLEYHNQDGTVEQVVISARGPGFPDGGEAAFRNRQGSFFLRAMLEDCWEIPLHVLESEWTASPGDRCSLLLAARLAAQLDLAWRKGALRFYRAFPRRDSRVQGRLDIAREIRQSMGLRDGRMAYEIREHTEDNDYNRLFLLACLEAERQYPNLMLPMRKLLPGYGAAFQALRGAPWGGLDANTLLDRTRKKITNPIYRDYEVLRGISRAFLRRHGGSSQAVETGGGPFVTGVLLDISQLWERYLLKKVLPEPDSRRYQSEERILDGKMPVIPDFLWRDHRVVLDAKYKFKWGDTLNRGREDWSGFIHKDVYQVLTYMLELDCPQGGVVFPVDQACFLKRCGAASMEELTPARLQIPVGRRGPKPAGGGAFWRFPFAVPSEGLDYNVFRQAMDQEAGRLSKQIAGELFRVGSP